MLSMTMDLPGKGEEERKEICERHLSCQNYRV